MRKHRFVCIGVMVLVSVVAIAGFGVFVWRQNGMAKHTGHVSMLCQISAAISTYADTHGCYPDTLPIALEREFLRELEGRLDLDDLVYLAKGKRPSDSENTRLFYERRQRRFGLDQGWHEAYVIGCRFRQDLPVGREIPY